jgi:hypothetical protein
MLTQMRRIINWEIEETTIRKNQALVTVIVHSMIRGIDIGREYLFRLEKKETTGIFKNIVW